MSTETHTPPTPKDAISVARRSRQLVHVVDPSRQIPLALHLITQNEWKQILVFAGTKKSADTLVKALEAANISAAAVHGNTGEENRALSVKNFNEGSIRVIVSTDMVAKAMNLSNITHLISLGLPAEPNLYLERLGYLGEEGRAITLVGTDESNALYTIERLLKRSIPQESVEGFTLSTETVTQPTHKPSRDERKPRRKEEKDSKPYAKRKSGSSEGKKPYSKDGRGTSGKKKSPSVPKRTGKTIRIKSLKPSEQEK